MFSFPTRHLQCWVTTGCPKKSYIQKLLDPECTRSITSSRHPSQPDLDEPVSGNYFFGRFLLRLSRIKRFQVMPRGKFGSAGCSTQFRLGFLNFSSSHFFGDTLYIGSEKIHVYFSWKLGRSDGSLQKTVCVAGLVVFHRFSIAML